MAASSGNRCKRRLTTPARWLQQFWDPRRTITAFRSLPAYARDVFRYRRLARSSSIGRLYLAPQLHDRSAASSIEQHYFFLNGWALRKIVADAPLVHVDLASQVTFANSVAAATPTVFVDIRPLFERMSGLHPVAGDLLATPFRDDSLVSISCLHVAEHVGLGRYGDALDPDGTRKACRELARVLAPGGSLYFGIPIGAPRVYFNAHRIHTPAQILDFFRGLELSEFSAVDDDDRFVVGADPLAFETSDYACGMFHLRKPTR